MRFCSGFFNLFSSVQFCCLGFDGSFCGTRTRVRPEDGRTEQAKEPRGPLVPAGIPPENRPRPQTHLETSFLLQTEENFLTATTRGRENPNEAQDSSGEENERL